MKILNKDSAKASVALDSSQIERFRTDGPAMLLIPLRYAFVSLAIRSEGSPVNLLVTCSNQKLVSENPDSAIWAELENTPTIPASESVVRYWEHLITAIKVDAPCTIDLAVKSFS